MNKLLKLFVISTFLIFGACDHDAPPRIVNPVNDYANVLSQYDRDTLSSRLIDFQNRTHIQVALLTVGSTGGEPIEDFSHRTAEAWAGGQHGVDNGVLITLAINDHRSRIEVGRGLEGTLTDGFARSLLNDARPSLRHRDYSGAFNGILSGVITQTSGLSIAETNSCASSYSCPQPVHQQQDSFPWTTVLIILGVILLIALIVWMVKSSNGSSGGGGGSSVVFFKRN